MGPGFYKNLIINANRVSRDMAFKPQSAILDPTKEVLDSVPRGRPVTLTVCHSELTATLTPLSCQQPLPVSCEALAEILQNTNDSRVQDDSSHFRPFDDCDTPSSMPR